MLPKLALGILMVPFSWWFVQWTISISAIVTASVITIPNETIHSLSDSTDWINTKSMQRNYSVNNEDTKDTNATCPTDGPEKCISPMEILQNGAGMYSYMMVYGYSIFKIQDVQKLS